MTKTPNITNIIPITDLHQDASAVLKRVNTSRQPLIITQRGRAAAVIVSIEAYKKVQTEMDILRLLACGEKGIDAGNGCDFHEVFAEVDVLLK